MTDSGVTADADETLAAAGSPARRAPSARLEPGEVVGRYTVDAVIGSGAMGVVYRAHDPELDREVALKIVDRLGREATRAREAFFSEARTLAKLSSPHVVAVFDVGTHEDGVFIAMEHIEGSTLDDWLAERPREKAAIVDVYVQAGRGLADAHTAGIVHGDFKPSNVMVDATGRARVLDFGLARPADDVSQSSEDPRTGFRPRAGTPAYMAPELFAGEAGDARGDQFAFCVALWEGLVGERPFPGDTVPAIATATALGRIRPIPASARIPRWLQRALRRGLRAHPEERWPSMNVLLRELTRARRGLRYGALATAVIAATGLAFYVGARRDGRAQCETTIDQRLGFWDEARAREVSGAISATRRPYAPQVAERVSARADEYVEAWRRASIEVCMQNEQPLEPRLRAAAAACLEDRRTRFDALATVLMEVTADELAHVDETLDGLPPINECLDPVKLRAAERGEPPDPATARAAADIRSRLARVWALSELARYEQAREMAEACVAEAEQLDFSPIRYEARAALGAQLVDLDRYDRALEHLRRAYELSVELDDPKAQMASALSLAFRASLAGDIDAARHWLFVAGARESHPSVEDWTRGRFHLIAAEIDQADRRAEDALGHQRRAQELFRRSAGPDSVAYATQGLRLALVLQKVGQTDEALELIDHAIVVLRGAYGDEHPTVANALNSRAFTLLGVGRVDDAVRHLEQAVDIWQRVLSPDNPTVASALVNLCRAHADLGKFDSALGYCDEALSLRERQLGPQHLYVAYTRTDRGELLRRVGRLDQALADAESSAQSIERQLGPDHPNLADALTLLGRTLSDLGRPSEAIPVLRRALTARESAEYEHVRGENATTQFALALALASTRDHGAEALALAQRARVGFAATSKQPKSPLARDEAALAAWLERNGPPE